MLLGTINLSNYFFSEYGRCLLKAESDRRKTSLWGVPCDDLLNELRLVFNL